MAEPAPIVDEVLAHDNPLEYKNSGVLLFEKVRIKVSWRYKS